MKSCHRLGAVPELVVDGEILLDLALSETVTLNLVLAPNSDASITLP
jgi:phosphotransacetylase